MAWEGSRDVLHADLAERWAAALGGGTRDHVVPLSAAEVRELLTALAAELDAVAHTGGTARAAQAGARLADAHFVGDEVLGRSVAAISSYFAAIAVTPDRAAEVLAAFSSGYMRAFRAWLLSEQESVHSAAMTARRRAEKRLRASEARLRAVFSQAGIGTGLSDMTGRIIEVNAAFAGMLGYLPEEMLELNVAELTHPEDPPAMWELYAGVLRGDHDNVQTEKAYLHRDGHTVWTNINVSLIRDEHGQPQFTLVLVEDISEQRALRERLHFRAHHDPLTGLANRTRFFDALTAAFADPAAHVGLCYVDLDHFKSVNDTFGHAAGDELLTQAAARLSACITQPDYLVARMGGDEFVVLVPRSGGSGELARLARTVLAAFAAPFYIHGHRLGISASVGVTVQRAGQLSADELLQSADTTMYWAKADGRARYAVFDPDRRRREHTRAELSAAMPGALGRGEFFLEFQPIVSLADRTPLAVEALVRWRHPELGVLTPTRFVELAEDSGHIGALGAVVLAEACRAAREWHDRYGAARTPVLSVNVSAAEVADPTWLDGVQRIVAETGMDPHRLQLELTERAFMHATGRPLQVLRALAASGVRIAIDDFGTGYSNLAYLGQLPLHVVKLAGPFIHRIRTPSTSRRSDLLVLQTVIDLSHELGLAVTAECVETQHQAERLLDLGCDTAQGWFFHHPMPAEQITKLLADTEFRWSPAAGD
ncbi:diguanylate cyclase (GGDEF)-like protein/PAS domain S-box-containing protein [Nocardia transvalensis]|uniref:Diguanylate cyclase (GGDEF)-like protein/PAS domain S-box-containing protein n=1 Tax=Nocardia transvalensis TaxID=37333 RepID=A0A7W9PL19_9NOCA|nr:GGDEF domain-containing phosphodiesterase [Nocardia transvalensis]MBB5917579.1 diguanylate cyclase (GGDEF)-like protein/PAS domain S-box-containing protein [Nocardia transvalensis]